METSNNNYKRLDEELRQFLTDSGISLFGFCNKKGELFAGGDSRNFKLMRNAWAKAIFYPLEATFTSICKRDLQKVEDTAEIVYDKLNTVKSVLGEVPIVIELEKACKDLVEASKSFKMDPKSKFEGEKDA